MAESRWLTAVGVGLLLALGPVLVLPELLPLSLRVPIVLAGTVGAFVLAIALVGPSRGVGFLVGLLAVTVAAGWSRASASPVALSHLAGAAVGLLSMSVVASWCRTESRLAVAVVLFLVLGTGVLAVGMAGAPLPSPKLVESGLALGEPRLKLGLPGLEAGGQVNPNALAGTALLIAPVAGALVFLPRRGVTGGLGLRFIGMLLGGLAGYVIYVTQSRSAWLAVWLTLLALSLRIGSRWFWRIAALLGLLLLPVVAAACLWSSEREVFGRMVVSAQRTSAARFAIISQGIEQLRASPWSGVGLNQFRRVYKPVAGVGPADVAHAHNIFLQTGLDLGLVGLGVYGGLIALLMIRSDRAARGRSALAATTAAGAGLSLVGAHVFGLGDAISLGAKVGLFQWLAGGLILAAWRIQRGDMGPLGQNRESSLSNSDG